MTREQIRQAADILRETVSTRDYAARIGLQVNRSGFAQCFMHDGDRNGSLKFYDGRRGYHCFGCGASGDVIELAKQYYGLNFPQAIAKVAEDTGTALPGFTGSQMTKEQAEAIQAARQRKRENEVNKAVEKAADEEYWQTVNKSIAISDYCNELEEKIVRHLKEHPIIMPENLEPGIYEDENDENVYPDEELMDSFFAAMKAKERINKVLDDIEYRRNRA